MTTPPVICAPSWVEVRALSRGLPPGSVTQVGIGRRTASRSAQSPRVASAAARAVVGTGGGVQAGQRTGDVVVATEVRGPQGVTFCASAPLLAGQLRRAGLTVHTGPVRTTRRVITGAQREEQARAGVMAVDMESSWLVYGADVPVAVLRVLADDASSPLLRLATLRRFHQALSILPLLGPSLVAWQQAVRPRQVLLFGPRSFYAGLVPPAVRAEATRQGLDVIDATVPLDGKDDTGARRFADAGETVVFIGDAGREESDATLGERPAETVLVEGAADARTVAVADPDRVSYLAQTTCAAEEVAEVVGILTARFPRLRHPSSDDICDASTNRQGALHAVAPRPDLALVIGSSSPSSSQRLAEHAARLGTPAHLIDDADGIDLQWLDGVTTVALTAEESAPASLVQDVVAALRGLGPVEAIVHEITIEDLQLTLPKEVRQP